MDPFAAARFNVFWFLSLLLLAMIMLSAAYWRRRSLLIVAALVSIPATYYMSTTAVVHKWQARYELARTDTEIQRASKDGANLVFTALFFAPFEAILYTSLWGYVGWRFSPRRRRLTTH